MRDPVRPRSRAVAVGQPRAPRRAAMPRQINRASTPAQAALPRLPGIRRRARQAMSSLLPEPSAARIVQHRIRFFFVSPDRMWCSRIGVSGIPRCSVARMSAPACAHSHPSTSNLASMGSPSHGDITQIGYRSKHGLLCRIRATGPDHPCPNGGCLSAGAFDRSCKRGWAGRLRCAAHAARCDWQVGRRFSCRK